MPIIRKQPLYISRYNDYIGSMTGRLKAEIKQRRPFTLLEEEAFLNIQRTADVLMRAVNETLKSHGLSSTQYNVLRILRGAGDEGLACREIGERMVTKDPDITRLLDRMEARHLVTRAREERDRRRITVRITKEGLKLLTELDPVVEELNRRLLSHLGERNLRALISLLEQARTLPA